jgi:hypothetical protein
MPLPVSRRFLPAGRKLSLVLFCAVLLSVFTGCGFFHGSADVGSDLKPHLGTSVSFPIGK